MPQNLIYYTLPKVQLRTMFHTQLCLELFDQQDTLVSMLLIIQHGDEV